MRFLTLMISNLTRPKIKKYYNFKKCNNEKMKCIDFEKHIGNTILGD